uniref:Neurotransmitter-gated ion-channel ligand-binding domain-containing protein n=1 Tax=Panagrolaimus sp. ES5 TaxID=591445 RepID=A0AC34GPZ3_9BILA
MDEVAVWDPSKFNNIRNTLAKQWELWQPDLKVANSVSGVNQFFEISRRSHATLESISPTSTKVQTYPTFLMKIGCHFDYSNYPYDIQKCALRLYPAARMNEVVLKVYYELSPSVLLGWGEEAENKHIGEWNLFSVDNNITYFRKRKFSNERPPNAFEASRTWSIFMVYVTLERHVALYWVTMGLPAIISSVFNIFSFLFEKPENAIMVTIGNLFFQIVFLQDFIRELPPAVGQVPPIVRFANALLIMTIIAMLAHLFIKRLKTHQSKLPPKYSRYIYNGLESIKKRGKTLHTNEEEGHEEIEVNSEFTSFGVQNDKPLMMHFLLRGILFSFYTLLTFFLCLYYLW